MTQSLLGVPTDADCSAAVEGAAKLCESLGHQVTPATPKLDVERVWGAYGRIVSVGVASQVGLREAALGRSAGPEDLEPINRRNAADGKRVSGIDYHRARDVLHGASRSLGAFMRDYDAILSPTMAFAPPRLGLLSLSQPYADFVGPATLASAFTALFNITGQPAMSVPLHWSESGLPIGVQFAARLGDEATLFRLATQLEQARPWFDRLPPV